MRKDPTSGSTVQWKKAPAAGVPYGVVQKLLKAEIANNLLLKEFMLCLFFFAMLPECVIIKDRKARIILRAEARVASMSASLKIPDLILKQRT